jgi:hypothetical protein
VSTPQHIEIMDFPLIFHACIFAPNPVNVKISDKKKRPEGRPEPTEDTCQWLIC